jgi:hypothetical protein
MKGKKFLNQLPAFVGQFSMQSATACSYELQSIEFYDEDSYLYTVSVHRAINVNDIQF